MFREMRRIKQQLPENEALEILKNGEIATFAFAGDGDYPYSLPINYVYYDGKIYFHCAKTGHKIDAIKRNDKVSFSIIGEAEILQEKYTTLFKSVIGFGRASFVEDEAKMKEVATALAEALCPDFKDGIAAEVEREFPALCVVEVEIEHLTGKECIEFTRKR